MKKFLALLGAVGLTATSSMAVIACGTEAEGKTNDLSKESINTSLGQLPQLELGIKTPTNQAIYEAFNKVNKNTLATKVDKTNTTINELSVDGVNGSAKIIALDNTDNKLTGQATISFEVKLADKINLTFKVESMEEFNRDTEEDDIKQTFKSLNPEIFWEELNLLIKIETNGTGTITITVNENSIIYNALSEPKIINFKIDNVPAIDLGNETVITNLGQLPQLELGVRIPTNQAIYEAFNNVNEQNLEVKADENNSTIEELNVDGTNGSAKIIALDIDTTNKLLGQATISFEVKLADKIDLTFKTEEMDQFKRDTKEAEIKQTFKSLNPEIYWEELNLVTKIETNGTGTITVTVNENSIIYNALSEPKIINFKIDNVPAINLKDAIKNNRLGEFDSNPTEEELVSRINSLNEGLDLKASEIKFFWGDYDDVQIEMKNKERYFGISYLIFSVNEEWKLNHDINQYIEKDDLGIWDYYEIGGSEHLSTIGKENPQLDFTELEIVEDINGHDTFLDLRKVQTIFRAKPGSKKYSGKAKFVAHLDPEGPELLYWAIRNNHLGDIPENERDPENIFDKIKEFNPDFSAELSELSITPYLPHTVFVEIKKGFETNYIGKVLVYLASSPY